MHTDCELGRCEKCDKERAVIEAAQWVVQVMSGNLSVFDRIKWEERLRLAVEALDSEEE